jgi:hypothetical protein
MLTGAPLRQVPSNRLPQNRFSEEEEVAIGIGGSMRHVLLATFVLFAAMAAAQAPNFSGTWKLDRDLTTADMRWDKTDTLMVSQSDDDVRFEYWDRDGRPLGTNRFTSDNVERFWYKTRMELAWARAHWDQGKLVVESHVNLDFQGYQYYLGTDTWELSPDGKTLIDRLRDGKSLVFQRQTPSHPASAQH